MPRPDLARALEFYDRWLPGTMRRIADIIDPSSGKPAWLLGARRRGRIPRAAECVKLACLIWRPIAVVEASGARPVPDSVCRADAGGWMAAYRARDLAALARRPREPGGCQAELQMLIEGLALRRPPRHGEE